MEKQFVTYEIALVMKELGFDEECFGYYRNDNKFFYFGEDSRVQKDSILSPIWQQCIDFFREKQEIDIEIHSKFGQGCGWWANLCYNPTRTEVLNVGMFNDYYKAREQAILKCIELCKNK